MSGLLDVVRGFAAWCKEGLTKLGTQLLQAYGWPAPPFETEFDAEADRETWDEERERLALSPWWM